MKKTPTPEVTTAYEVFLANLEPASLPAFKADPIRFWIAAWTMAEGRMLEQVEQAGAALEERLQRKFEDHQPTLPSGGLDPLAVASPLPSELHAAPYQGKKRGRPRKED